MTGTNGTNLTRLDAAIEHLDLAEWRTVRDLLLGALAAEVDAATFDECLELSLRLAGEAAS